jgi:hypothetical protein
LRSSKGHMAGSVSIIPLLAGHCARTYERSGGCRRRRFGATWGRACFGVREGCRQLTLRLRRPRPPGDLSFGEREEIAIEMAREQRSTRPIGSWGARPARSNAKCAATPPRAVATSTIAPSQRNVVLTARQHGRPGQLASKPALRTYVERHLSGLATNVDGTGFAGPKVI